MIDQEHELYQMVWASVGIGYRRKASLRPDQGDWSKKGVLDVLLDGLYQNGAWRVDYSYVSAFATQSLISSPSYLMCTHSSEGTVLSTNAQYSAKSTLYGNLARFRKEMLAFLIQW